MTFKTLPAKADRNVHQLKTTTRQGRSETWRVYGAGDRDHAVILAKALVASMLGKPVEQLDVTIESVELLAHAGETEPRYTYGEFRLN